jgi:hypothetical protein
MDMSISLDVLVHRELPAYVSLESDDRFAKVIKDTQAKIDAAFSDKRKFAARRKVAA